MLIILDGWGVKEGDSGNAIAAANTPNFDKLFKDYPNTTLKCSGKAVGLPDGQMGNSEVGHLNIGAGRIVRQEFTKIADSIEDRSFFNNPVLLQAIENVKKSDSDMHLMGLLSDGGVHSHIEQLFALLELCREKNIDPALHMFLDGRDVGPKSALTYIDLLEAKIKELGTGHIATVMGRYYAMDRDNRWERVEKAYEAMVSGKETEAKSAADALKQAYARGETDEFVQPTVISVESGVLSSERKTASNRIKENDSVLFFNFRPDRAREITSAFINPDFSGFKRSKHPPHVFFVSLTQYNETFDIPVAFAPERPTNILADVLAENNLKQLRIAETEKYAHVTFFFNGGVEAEKNLEERILIPSPKVATYDLKPEMSANEVTAEVINQIEKDSFDVIILNFANPDMVGHTGVLKATIKAIETLDTDVAKIVEAVSKKNGMVMITADHGNAEKMATDTDKPFTAHTSEDVPFMLIENPNKIGTQKLRNNGILADIAPTILDILGVDKPVEMSGKTLIEKS